MQAKRRTGQPGTRPDAKRRASAWLAACPPAVQGGNPSGHDRLLWAARGLIGGFGLPRPVAEKLLVDEFNPRCVPPWNLGDPSEARDFFRKLDESERLPFGKPAGWLLDAEPERRNRNGAPSSTASAPATGQGNGAGVALPEIVAIDDLVQRHPALRKPVVHGLLRLGEVGNIVSAPKAGKSWLGYSLAMAVVSGRRWLDTFPTAQGRVLLVDNELDASLLASRLPKVAKAMAVERSVYGPRLDVVHLRGRLCSLDELLPLCETAAERGYSLVILDSLYRFASPGVSENDNTAMACTYNTLNQLAALVDAALVVIHHSSKGSQSEKATTDIGAGGGSQSRAADAHIVLREHDVPGAFTLDAVVRSWPPPQRLAVAWKYPAWRSAPDLNPERIKLPERRDDGRQRKRDSAGRAQLIQVLETSPATVSELRRGTGISKDRAERLLGLLVAEGRVVIEPVVKRGNQTHRYHLVPKDLPGGVDTPNGTNTPPFEGA